MEKFGILLVDNVLRLMLLYLLGMNSKRTSICDLHQHRIAIAWYSGASGEQLKGLYHKLYTDAFR